MNLLSTLSALVFSLTLLIGPDAFASTGEQIKARNAFNIASYNIRNYGRTRDNKSISTNNTELAKIISSTKSHLIAVQEIYDADGFKSFVKENFPKYRVLLSRCGGGGKQKLGFIYNPYIFNILSYNEDARVADSDECDSGVRPAMIAEFQVKRTGLKFTAMALHLKAGGRQRNADFRYKQYGILTKIVKELKRSGKRNFILMGDFNTTDYLKRNHNYDRFINFIEENNLVSFADDMECTAYWWGGVDDGLQHGSHLDHILISESLYDKFSSPSADVHAHCKKAACEIESADYLGVSYKNVSDHCPVVATLK